MTTPTIVPRTERAVCVMGMHRSGTWSPAAALHCRGVPLGAAGGLRAPGPDNPAGYFENRDIKELNDGVLAHLGGFWDQPPVLERGWEQDGSLDSLRTSASDVLGDAFGPPPSESGLIGWKDPRLSLLLPFWRTVTPIETTIVVVRDPAEVTASLRARNGIEPPQAAMLWLRYLFAATANDPDHLLVLDRDFFIDLPRTLSSVPAHLVLPPPDQAVTVDAREHVDRSHRHHVPAIDDYAYENSLV